MADRLDTEVLVVGAGPVGLTLALQARLMGTSVRIVDRLPGPRVWSPALAVHPRTLEILRGLGVADALIDRSVTDVALEIHFPGSVVRGRLHDLKLPETEFPFILFAPQPEVETVLAERLRELGVPVEWETELTDVELEDGAVVARLRTGSRNETLSSRYLVGCDGAESAVRKAMEIPFRGRRYRESIVVADVTVVSDLSTDTAHAFARERGMFFLFPLPCGDWRLIAPGGETAAGLVETLTSDMVDGVRIEDVRWVREIRPQHRLAGRYREGSVFLAGDAAHVHSPAGAQGMNTGIQDAANLGWKLALCVGGAPESLLDTYEIERRPVALQVVRLTGLAYALEVSQALPLRLGRRHLARPVASILLPRPGLVSLVARAVSGLDTSYRRGAIGARSRRPRKYLPGSRLPDVVLEDGSRLHHLVSASSFHLLVPADQPVPIAPGAWLRIHVLDRETLPGRLGHLLVRPDGYVASSGAGSAGEAVTRFARSWIGDSAARIPVG